MFEVVVGVSLQAIFEFCDTFEEVSNNHMMTCGNYGAWNNKSMPNPTPHIGDLRATWLIDCMIRCRASSFHSPLVVGARREASALVGVQASLHWWPPRRRASTTVPCGLSGYLHRKMQWWWWWGCRPTVLGKVGDHIKVTYCVHECKGPGLHGTILVYHMLKF